MTAPRDNRPLDYAILQCLADNTAAAERERPRVQALFAVGILPWEIKGLTEKPFPEEALADRWPRKVIERRLDVLADKGLIECGVSVRTGWLTDLGKQRLEALRAEVGA